MFGGKFVPETLMAALDELESAYRTGQRERRFPGGVGPVAEDVRRPAHNPCILPKNLTRHCGGAKIFLKREDLAHTGAHKINNALGQALLARHMGKGRIIAETETGAPDSTA